MEINGKSALVTGGGSGLGAATAQTLADAGAKVAVLDLRLDGAQKTADSFGGLAVECDVGDADSAVAAVAQAREAQGPASILVNCAGIGYAASKAGVVGMGIALAREFAREGIRVMAISPGPFDTPLFQSMPEGAYQRLLNDTQFPKRPGQPKEYGQLVVDIVENVMLNGESIRLDGALRMGPR